MRKHLRSFPLFDESHLVRIAELNNKGLWAGYRTTNNNAPTGATHFDLNIIGETCYILWIELLKIERGQNYGRTLYRIIEDFAREIGCDRVRLTPSGWCPTGKTRREYMLALGYREAGTEFEKIL